jgi:hypothetical protein
MLQVRYGVSVLILEEADVHLFQGYYFINHVLTICIPWSDHEPIVDLIEPIIELINIQRVLVYYKLTRTPKPCLIQIYPYARQSGPIYAGSVIKGSSTKKPIQCIEKVIKIHTRIQNPFNISTLFRVSQTVKCPHRLMDTVQREH